MVNKFKQILKKLNAEKGSVSFFAILKMDEYTDKWTVILSASWAKEGEFQDFKFLVEVVKSILTKEEVATIARYGIFEKTNHLVELLSKYKTDSVITGEKVNGNMVHEGHIIESNFDTQESVVVPIETRPQ